MLRTFIFMVSTVLLFLLSSCAESEPSFDDFREQWIGTYEGTKSNRGFDDNIFITSITFEVLIDEDSEDGLLINGTLVPISEDGDFGPDFIQGNLNYSVNFNGDDVRIEINVDNVLGLALPCFIIAEKI